MDTHFFNQRFSNYLNMVESQLRDYVGKITSVNELDAFARTAKLGQYEISDGYAETNKLAAEPFKYERAWNDFPPGVDVRKGGVYKCNGVRFSFPFSKQPNILYYTPPSFSQNKYSGAYFKDGRIYFEYRSYNFGDEIPTDIEKEAIEFRKNWIKMFASDIKSANEERHKWNKQIEQTFTELVSARREMLERGEDQRRRLTE